MEPDPTWVFNILWTDEAHFSLHGDVNNHNCRIWATSNPREYTQKPLHSPKVTAWCGFTGSFIIGPFFFETQCPVNGWITETVNAQRYLTFSVGDCRAMFNSTRSDFECHAHTGWSHQSHC
ncbi:DUF4817 domain-containing protein [Trichonephila clavipes]|nr:DUF4817 domain-containing protein [Trichonephila clavipes]